MKHKNKFIFSLILVAFFIISVVIRNIIIYKVLTITDLNESFKFSIFFELGLVVIGLICCKYIFSWNNVGFKKSNLNLNNLKWCLGYILVIVPFWIYLCIIIIKNYPSLNISLVLITILMSILVGIAEELFYRGFVFHSINNKLLAVFISSALFGLMHLTNILNNELWGVIIQVVMTFIVGIAFSVTLLKVKNIIPLIIMHTTFDLISFMDGLFKNGVYFPGIFRILFIITLLITAIIVFINIMVEQRKWK